MRFAEPMVHLVRGDPAGARRLSDLLLSQGMQVAAFSTAAEYLAAGRDERPACVILDLILPDSDGLELQRRLSGSRAPPVIFVTGECDLVSVVRAMKDGAIDFLIEPVDVDRLVAAVELALLEDSKRRSLLTRWRTLTRREAQVFHHTVAGLLNKQAAAALGVAENTYEVHRGRVMRKMKAQSLADLVRMSTKLEPMLEARWQEEAVVAQARWSRRGYSSHGLHREGLA